MAAYYNENCLKTAAWLRELIKAGLVADGEVDTRSIVDVSAEDVRGFTQCHWFAGIGGWSYALRLAGWPDTRECWTGSCPCQPFSSAGAQAGGHDPRDLWPAWFNLISECRPGVIFGEQVEAAIGHGWLDRLHDDLEGEGYAVGAVGLPSACAGAFDIRQRLWFVAESQRTERGPGWAERDGANKRRAYVEPSGSSDAGLVADPNEAGQREQRSPRLSALDLASCGHDVDGCYQAGELGTGIMGYAEVYGREGQSLRADRDAPDGVAKTGFWDDCDWIPCRDGKSRPVESGTFPLAHGVPARVGRLRGYGNAINPWVAKEVIAAYMDIRHSPQRVEEP